MKIISKITSTFLAIIFLLSSLGFTANKMICLKSGKTKVSLVAVEDCCAEKESPLPILKAQCCDIANSTFHLNDFNFSQKNNIPVANIFILPSVDVSLTIETLVTTSNQLSYSKQPPLLYGRQLLSFIQVLTI